MADRARDDDDGVVFRDVITLALLGFVCIVILLLPYIAEPVEEDSLTPGNVMVEVRWEDNLPTDVDLWFRAPNDRAVGYSSTTSRYSNLLRDDLGGDSSDPNGLNMEHAFTRGVVAGEYVVNLHLYRHDRAFPVVVDVVFSVKAEGKKLKRLLIKRVELQRLGHEITVWRVTLDKYGDILSYDDLPTPLRIGR